MKDRDLVVEQKLETMKWLVHWPLAEDEIERFSEALAVFHPDRPELLHAATADDRQTSKPDQQGASSK